MGLLSNRICRRQLKRGDHIYCYRKWHVYSHHGILVEADRVIHYTKTKGAEESEGEGDVCKKCDYDRNGKGGVVKTCIDCFLSGHSHLYLFEYEVSAHHKFIKNSGTCCTGSCDSVDQTIGRATEKLDNGFDEYDLLENNCEAFAVFCKTGKAGGDQAFAFKCFIKVKFGRKKSVFKIPVTIRLDRLLRDVQVHHPDHLYKRTKEFIDPLRKLTWGDIVRRLKRFNIHENEQVEGVNQHVLMNDQDQEDVTDEEDVPYADEEEDGVAESSRSR